MACTLKKTMGYALRHAAHRSRFVGTPYWIYIFGDTAARALPGICSKPWPVLITVLTENEAVERRCEHPPDLE